MRHLALASLVAVASGSAVWAKGRTVPKAPAAAAPAAPAIVKITQRITPPLDCDRLTIGDGLPNSTVHAIVQDKRGFMWLGTEDGLVRYDGIKPFVYRHSAKDPTSISSGFITALALDDSGKLWVGTPENGVDLYDPDTDHFTHFGQGKSGISSDGVTAIAHDRAGHVWFAMVGGGLNRWEPGTSTFTQYTKPPLDTPISAIDVDDKGNLWLGTVNASVIRWNPSNGATSTFRPTLEDERLMSDSPIPALIVGSTGTVWVGSDGNGVFALDPTSGKFVQHHFDANDAATLSDDHISTIYEDRNKSVWIGTPKGLNRMDPSGHVIRYQHDATDPTSLSFPWVLSLYQDAGGVMWVGGLTVGVCKFDEARHKFGHQYVRGTFATAFFEDPDGTLWVGSYTGGLYKYERKAQRVTVYTSLGPLRLDEGYMWGLHRDRRGILWISIKGQGLIGFDTANETYKQYLPNPDDPNSLPVDFLSDIWEDDKGILWLASYGGGLVKFDPVHETFTAITQENGGLSSNFLYRLYPDPTDKKVLWIGTAKGGLVKYDLAAGTSTAFRKAADNPASLSNDDVLTIYRDKAGILWLGTYGGGLNRLDPSSGKVESYTTATSALTNDQVLGILPDDDGKLWLSTSGGGLLQFDPATRKFLAFDQSDGVQDNEFGQGAFMRSKSGELFFGGAGGFNAFFAKNITRDAYVPPLVMTGIRVLNQDIKLDKPIWLLPKIEVSYADSFELQFAALSFASPKRNRYSYKLEGIDSRFIDTDRPYANYARLPGGDYTLRVRAANEHGVWNEAGIALHMKVTPPIWLTWQAYVTYVVVGASLIFFLFRLQRQKLRRIERESRLAMVENDLALTGAVQSGFLPEHSEIASAHVQMVGFYRPADTCSGDWWWHEQLPSGRHVILVGDVTGHGPGPAMVTAAVAGAFRVLIETGLDDIQQGLAMLNREVVRVAKGKYHMTMAALELDEGTGRWTLCNAGAPPMLSLGRDGKHKVHFCPGTPLGTESGFALGIDTGNLLHSERLLLYTDGIPEIAMPSGKVLGMRKFAQVYERTRGQDVRNAAAAMVMHADQTQAGQAQQDDWTFAMIEWG